MADNTSKSGKAKGPAAGMRRVRISYSPDGFRGVKDVDAELAAILVAEKRAEYVDDDTPTGEDEAPAGEFRGPASARADTSSAGADSSATAASTTSTPSSSTR